ncbi:GNAT family N-acetyltransferase [Neobacillus jeddahensis]|uniref:GNAT family N-acetyltransferase n=1 Tax=Neobacillus jeddahensis TaxID=1461580 RepID=UPI00058AEB0A|nr:GNAT family N-acetyltransferase [Neobacillus jeddahensis]
MTERSHHLVQINPWEEQDLDLLYRLNSPEMMEHLGGPETEEQTLNRHKRYLEHDLVGRMFSVQLLPNLESVGSVGYWPKIWKEELVYETGWSVLPAYQGNGIATAAMKIVIEEAAAENKYPYMHAFPSIDNPASNAVCRKLGFQRIAECEFEYPPGALMRCHDWRIKLNG